MGTFTDTPNPNSGATNVPLSPNCKYGAEARMQRYQRHWKENGLPDATHFITVNIPRDVLDEFCDKGEPVTSYVTKLLKGVVCRVKVRDPSYRPDYIWVLEAHNGIHVHIAIRLPNRRIALEVESYLAERFGLMRTKCSLGCPEIRQCNSGLPVHVTKISSSKFYSGSDRSGFEGLLDYISKSLYENARRRKGANLGKLVGASQSVTQRR